MLRDHSIFIASNESPEGLRAVLQQALDIELSLSSESSNALFEYTDKNRGWLTVGTHELENDNELMFQNYPYQIEIGGFSDDTWEAYYEKTNQFAEWIFDTLKHKTQLGLMWVEDVQKLIQKHEP